MRKKIIKILFAFILTIIFIPKAYASGLNVYASKTVASIGNSIIITVKADNLAGKFSVSSSNQAVLAGSGGQDWIEGTMTYTFTAKSAGSATVTVSPMDVADYSGNVYTASRSITITVRENRTLSTNSFLSSLSIDGATLTPTFNKNTLEYSTELKAGTTEINVNATKEDNYASITGTGKVAVNEGINNIEVTVTAENGATRTYKIAVNVKELDPINLKINKQDFTVIRKKDQLIAPENYKETTTKINDQEVPALYNDQTKLTLIGLKDKKGNINLYIYNSKKKTYKIYNEIKSGITVLVLDITKNMTPKDYFKTYDYINDIKTVVYKINKSSNLMLIYGMNTKTLKKTLYTYDKKDNTIQAYDTTLITKVTNNLNKKLKNYYYISLGLGILSFILIIILIIVSSHRKINNKKTKEKVTELFKEK